MFFASFYDQNQYCIKFNNRINKGYSGKVNSQHPIPESKMAVGGGNGPGIGMLD
jgi:hypothetical protein